MEHHNEQQRIIAIWAMASHYTLDGLHVIWERVTDQAAELGLHDLIVEAYQPITDYYVDGIDEAADDEQQSNLKRIVAEQIYTLSVEVQHMKRNMNDE